MSRPFEIKLLLTVCQTTKSCLVVQDQVWMRGRHESSHCWLYKFVHAPVRAMCVHRYHPRGRGRRQEGGWTGVWGIWAHGPIRVQQAVCWHQSALAKRDTHLRPPQARVRTLNVAGWRGHAGVTFVVFNLNKKMTHSFHHQVGEGGRNQCCHGDLISSPPWRPAGDPALHQPAEG